MSLLSNMTSLSQHFSDIYKAGSRLLLVSNLSNPSSLKDAKYRIEINLVTRDVAMNQTFWVGVYPGLYKKHLSYTTEKWKNFLLMVFK
jgi:CDP-6-deoxy-D-xylo-4-hexulose-3-dehydrase